jgi:hypothetical protein
MKRLLTLSILLVFVMAVAALATQTRVNTMGEADNIVKDEANVMLYPSTILYYPKLVGAVVDGDELSNFYGHMLISGEETNPLVMGFYFQTYNDYFPYGTPGEFIQGMENTHLRWIGGMDMSGTPLALGLMYDQASRKYDNPGDKSEQSFFRFGAMLGASLMEKKLEAAGVLQFASWTNKGADGVKITEPSGDLYLAFRARYWMDPMGKWTLVPHLGFELTTEGYKVTATKDKRTWTSLDVDFGLGANYNVTEDVLWVGDFGFRLGANDLKYEPTGLASSEEKSGTLVLPYFRMGLDGKVFKWLDFRGGVISEWVMSTYEPDTDYKTTQSYASTTTYLGAGFNWGKFMIDTEFNPYILEEGPYFISGESNDMNFSVSLTYWLD